MLDPKKASAKLSRLSPGLNYINGVSNYNILTCSTVVTTSSNWFWITGSCLKSVLTERRSKWVRVCPNRVFPT